MQNVINSEIVYILHTQKRALHEYVVIGKAFGLQTNAVETCSSIHLFIER